MLKRAPIPRDWELEERNPLLDARSHAPYRFDPDGYVPYQLAATVVCLRRASNSAVGSLAPIRLEDLAVDAAGTHGQFGIQVRDAHGGAMPMSGRREVLLGQAQVVNFLKTDSADALQVMRYPGEYRFPGGRVDEADASPLAAARRELREEFLVDVADQDMTLRVLSATQTRKIRGASNMMVNFVALAEENPWLANLDVTATNDKLRDMEALVDQSISDGSWRKLSTDDRQALSPEVHELRWLPMREAIIMSQHSIGVGAPFVNVWQAEQFAKAGVKRRDPMSVTCWNLYKAHEEALWASNTGEEAAELQRLIHEENHRFSVNVHLLSSRRSVSSKL
eukprot:CAMPEP_0194485630 /NCGR_PEP_ID=MMETSP0253-20130528/6567_1 /TAXON_ID=2966 /ORGANISM="Noctiluca scintillans" /LENGTH=336 /DNA_ID=CAMNT_0039325629 /DNA_START=27 /DNA_END=1037 /DNA_ORIENTATION=-